MGQSLITLAQHSEIVLVRRSNLVPDDLAVQGAPGMTFEPIHRPSRAEPATCTSEFAAWRAFEGRDGKRLGIHSIEVQALDFGRELLDNRRQPGKPDAGLGLGRKVRTGIEFEQSPPVAEVRQFSVHPTTVQRYLDLNQQRQLGLVLSSPGRPRRVTSTHEAQLRRQLDDHPDATLIEHARERHWNRRQFQDRGSRVRPAQHHL